ncbi:unnamed protein product [Urochloa humidicola]
MSNQRGSRFDDDTRSVAARQNLDMRSLQQDNDSLQQKLRILEEKDALDDAIKRLYGSREKLRKWRAGGARVCSNSKKVKSLTVHMLVMRRGVLPTQQSNNVQMHRE